MAGSIGAGPHRSPGNDSRFCLAYERTLGANSDLVGVLREEILALIRRHVMVEPDKVQVKMGRGGATSTLAIDIELPN